MITRQRVERKYGSSIVSSISDQTLSFVIFPKVHNYCAFQVYLMSGRSPIGGTETSRPAYPIAYLSFLAAASQPARVTFQRHVINSRECLVVARAVSRRQVAKLAI